MKDFYVYLPSNASKNIYKSNTCAEYTVSLHQPLELHGKFNVAISEILYPAVSLDSFKSKIEKSDKGVSAQAKEIPSLMLIYSSVARESVVGDTRAPLLRVIPTHFTSKAQNTSTGQAFSPPYYLPVASNYFSEITVKITTQSGNPFPFPTGITLICLHFKQIDG
jgi:hypothetical protein